MNATSNLTNTMNHNQYITLRARAQAAARAIAGVREIHISTGDLPICWRGDDRAHTSGEIGICITGWVPFSVEDLQAAGYDSATCEAQAECIAARNESMRAEREQSDAKRAAYKARLAEARSAVLGRKLTGLRITINDYNSPVITRGEEGGHVIEEIVSKDMGGSNWQPAVVVNTAAGQRYAFIRHLVDTEGSEADQLTALRSITA